MKKFKLYLSHYILSITIIQLLIFIANSQKHIFDINNFDKKYGFGQRVIYEMNIRAFTNEGTFAAAEFKLFDLKLLGIDVICLTPIYKRDGGLNIPYQALDFRIPHPAFGSIIDLNHFVNSAHLLKMEVWLVWVPNHTSNNHPWLKEHPEYYTDELHPFSSYVSQLNYENENLRNEMTSILKYWIDKTDIDGFICDFVSSPYIPNDYWIKTIPELKSYKKGKSITIVGESDFTETTRLFGAEWDYDFAQWFQETALWKNMHIFSEDANKLKIYCDQLFNDERYSNLNRIVYLTNRNLNLNGNDILSWMYRDNKYSFTVLIFTLYGMPLIYNGQEIGGEQIIIVSKIDWNNRDSKMYNTIKTLTAMKHSIDALKDGKNQSERGSIKWIAYYGSVAAYIRKNGNSEVLVILNLGRSTIVHLNGITEGTYIKWLDSRTIGMDIFQEEKYLFSSSSIDIESKGYLVYELKNKKN